MITTEQIKEVLKGYDMNNIHIGSLGGHSALDVCRGAKKEGFKTVVVAQKGREETYTEHFKSDGSKGCVDRVIIVEKFSDIVKPDVQQRLRELNTIFIHSRYFWVYCNFTEIENDFLVPIFGTRELVRKEERDEEDNQYDILNRGGIRIPKQFSRAEDIDRLCIVKASEASRGYERAFFYVSSFEDYQKKSAELIANGTITEESLKVAVIEEFVIGPQINLNFFYSKLTDTIELLGTDMRRQTNIDGLLRLTAQEQLDVLKHAQPKYIEQGHVAVTMKESLIQQAFELGTRFVSATAQYGNIIGPFALQGAVVAGPPKEEFVIFDVSMRIPGSPGTMFTPYSGYLYGESMSVGQRIAMEIKSAITEGKIDLIVT